MAGTEDIGANRKEQGSTNRLMVAVIPGLPSCGYTYDVPDLAAKGLSRTINVIGLTAKVRVERLHPRSSAMGFSTRPKANREPLPKNRTRKPAARITHL